MISRQEAAGTARNVAYRLIRFKLADFRPNPAREAKRPSG
jgi:hypothetical protein